MGSIINILSKTYAIVFIPIQHSILELLHLTGENFRTISRAIAAGALTFSLTALLGYYHLAIWCLRWIGLGVLSSIGFGFGMHTFVLFLAPHIAAVTMAAHSCKSLDFPEPPYPDRLDCPLAPAEYQVTFLLIMRKVALESFMWGLGTAIGELPPYLAARLRAQAKRRSTGGDSIDSKSQSAGWELLMTKIIHKVGFMGILLCAAIPNPLFDAAGVASGIAQVPFLTFFGATLIGKAIIKVLLQSSFVVFLFHGNNLETLVGQIDDRVSETFPSLRTLSVRENLVDILEKQRLSVLNKETSEPEHALSLKNAFSWLICAIMILFVMSVVNALANRYKHRIAGKDQRRTQ